MTDPLPVVRPPVTVGRGVTLVLRGGLVVSASLILLGLALLALTGGAHLGVAAPSSLASVRSNVDPAATVLFSGLLVLVLTPVLRVGLSVVLFARLRDYRFTLITLFVCAVLVTTAVSGLYL